MLEETAIRYVNMSEDDLRLVSYGLVVAGAVLAAFSWSGQGKLKRGAYFAYSGALFLLASVVQFVWLESLAAMAGGYLWTFLLVDVVASVGIGYAFAVIAMARSRDAFDHSRMAVLAFVPLLNFWLLLAPSEHDRPGDGVPTPSIVTGALGVFVGLVLLLTGASATAFLKIEGERRIAVAQEDPAQQGAGVAFMIRSNGLEGALELLAADMVTPAAVDEATTLEQVEARGTLLRYVYSVDTDAQALTMSMQNGLIEHNCVYAGMAPVLDAGATVEHVYLQPGGLEIGKVVVTREKCGR